MSDSREPINSKRQFLKVGLGLTGTLMGAKALGEACQLATGEQALGPFFPRPGTPSHPVKEDTSPDVPIYLANDNDLTFVKGRSGTAQGQVVFVKGKVTDDQCKPLAGATLIIWQASKTGRYNHKGDSQNQDFKHPTSGQIVKRSHDPNFQYWGQTTTNSQGEYIFKTIIPGFYPASLEDEWYRPPHIHFMVAATGFPQFVTQMYFNGSMIEDNEFIQELNKQDLILNSPNLTKAQQQDLVVDFKQQLNGDLNGEFNIQISR